MAPEMPWVGLQSDTTLHEGVRTQNCKGEGSLVRVLRNLRFSAGMRERLGTNANCDGILDSQLGREVLRSVPVSLGLSLPFCSASQ